MATSVRSLLSVAVVDSDRHREVGAIGAAEPATDLAIALPGRTATENRIVTIGK
ncbi:hypothetical protein [Nocardia neocaledoniensis]|uniref:hypothetical protein n=1 Tax=Nocardia neocaledoniensis TaxID=236511 RepID=UPI00142DA417|nr:hypothetical protein [Nocardia neocaledoniensis]